MKTQKKPIKIKSAQQDVQCPHCHQDALERVRRDGREGWVFDRVFQCRACGCRSGRVPPGSLTIIARTVLALGLV